MKKPEGFGGFSGRSARADGDAGAAVTTTGKNKMSEEGIAAIIASVGTLIGNILPGVGNVIDSTNNAKVMPTAGVQYMSVPASGNKTLWWVLGGGLLLVVLLVLVLRKK